MQYFGSNNVKRVAERWLQVEMSSVEVDGAGCRWVELGESGWSGLEVGALFSNNHKIKQAFLKILKKYKY